MNKIKYTNVQDVDGKMFRYLKILNKQIYES